jgi:hypothetical protein
LEVAARHKQRAPVVDYSHSDKVNWLNEAPQPFCMYDRAAERGGMICGLAVVWPFCY